MKKGVVLSVHKFSITVLTPDGEFEKSRRLNRDYQIGEEITYTPTGNLLQSYLYFPSKKAAVISVFATCMLAFSIAVPRFSNHVSAYMTIDVNPSIELGLDDELQVIEVHGLNQDGKQVVAQLHDWKNEEISDVAKKIVLKTKELGYLNASTRKVIFSKTMIDEDKKLSQQLNQEVKTLSKQLPIENGEVQLIQATEKDRDKAKQQGISTGKFVEQKLNEQKRKNGKLKKDSQRKETSEKNKKENVNASVKDNPETVNNNKQTRHNETNNQKADTTTPIKHKQEDRPDVSKNKVEPKNKSNSENRVNTKAKGNSENKANTKAKK